MRKDDLRLRAIIISSYRAKGSIGRDIARELKVEQFGLPFHDALYRT
jgi:hypothetical protein